MYIVNSEAKLNRLKKEFLTISISENNPNLFECFKILVLNFDKIKSELYGATITRNHNVQCPTPFS